MWKNLAQTLDLLVPQEAGVQALDYYTKVIAVREPLIEVSLCQAGIGEQCLIEQKGKQIVAEIVGITANSLLLMPHHDIVGISAGALVKPLGRPILNPVGEGLLGRVVNGYGEVLDGGAPLQDVQATTLKQNTNNPMNIGQIDTILDVGVKSINALLTVGQGQRIGLLAGSGIGKSVLLGMMTQYAQADCVVLALIGERGREVKDFVDKFVTAHARKRCVVVASPIDTLPIERLYAAEYAHAIAEFFRAQGKNVLLIFDSLTRYAHAQRELGLALGEQTTTKGYPPSVYRKLAMLIERAGKDRLTGGAITGIYTVLAEGDELFDPVVDTARATLDGHIVLDRHLANRGHYPAINIHHSISRVMDDIVPKAQQTMARKMKRLLSIYEEKIDLVTMGAYVPGTDPELDIALKAKVAMDKFLQQDVKDSVDYTQTLAELTQLMSGL